MLRKRYRNDCSGLRGTAATGGSSKRPAHSEDDFRGGTTPARERSPSPYEHKPNRLPNEEDWGVERPKKCLKVLTPIYPARLLEQYKMKRVTGSVTAGKSISNHNI